MTDFNEALSISFSEIENKLFEKMANLFTETMTEILGLLDNILFEVRDSDRYSVKEIKKSRVDTLFGTVEYRRRVYLDGKTGERVYGLDEALGLKKRARLSPGLKQAAILQAVDGPSYRGARDSLKTFYGHQVLSHESIRQSVLDVGQRIQQEITRQRNNPQGKRKVNVLFIEADGLWMTQQGLGKRETRLVIAHEGWRPRSGATGEYELVHRTHCYADGTADDLWEEVSRQLYSTYDLSDTMVVINGDRAAWIRRGVRYFPQAIYQFDRFHLIRELKNCLRTDPTRWKIIFKALEANRPEEMLTELREVSVPDREKKKVLADLRQDLEGNPESIVDYRERLKAMGYDTREMRGLGAAESNMNKFSKRLKKQGRSWSKRGLAAMINAMAKRFEGTLGRFTNREEELESLLDEDRLRTGAGYIAREVVGNVATAIAAHVPLLGAGRTQSEGLSRFFHQLNNALPAGLS